MLCAIEAGTSDGSLIAASGTKCTPSGKPPAAPAASAMDSLVLPQPPGPVSVSSLLPPRRCPAWASSLVLPTKLVRGRGRRPGASRAPPATILVALLAGTDPVPSIAHQVQVQVSGGEAVSWANPVGTPVGWHVWCLQRAPATVGGSQLTQEDRHHGCHPGPEIPAGTRGRRSGGCDGRGPPQPPASAPAVG